MNWPPKDWRATMALVFSVLGAAVLTAFVWWGSASLLPGEGWSPANELHRLKTARWVLWIAIGGVVVVLIGLGMAITPRKIKGSAGNNTLEFAGGDEPTPAAAAQATADAAVREADAIAAQTER